MRKIHQHSLIIPIIILCLIAFFQKTGVAGPPFFTDDPEPVDYHHGEFYTAWTFIRGKGGTSGTLPHFEFNYGLWHELQFHLLTPFDYSRDKDTEENDGKRKKQKFNYGYGDTELGAKYRFVQETRWLPQIGTFPILEFPTGNDKRGLGNGKAQFFLPLWAQKSWGPWTTYGGGGHWFNHGEGNKNWTYLGWLLQRDFSKWLTLGGEIFFRSRDKVNKQNGLGLNFGGQINFTESHHLLFSSGTDVHGPRRVTAYLAYQWTF